MTHDLALLPIEQVRHDHHVGNASLVFEAQKDEAFRCPWALTTNHQSAHGDHFTIAAIRQQIFRAAHAILLEEGKAQIDGNAAAFFFFEAVGVRAGQGFD